MCIATNLYEIAHTHTRTRTHCTPTNNRQSYDISVNVMVGESNMQSTGTYDLKNPNFRYMSTPQTPPGSLQTNPTESFFDSQTPSSVAPPISSAYLQTHPRATRSSVQPGGFPSNHHSMGVLQTGTEVIPVVNGSIISPSVQPQPSSSGLQLGQSATDPTHQSYQYPHPRQNVQIPHWGHSVPTSAIHQHGMGVGGIGDIGMGPHQHGMGTLQYGMGEVVQGHSNLNNAAGVSQYQQKWASPHHTVLASRS